MQRPGLFKEATAAVTQIKTLTAVVAFTDQLLLHQASGEPSPAQGLNLRQGFGQAAQIGSVVVGEGAEQHLRRLRPVVPTDGRQASIATATGRSQLADREQQGLLSTGFPFRNRLHAPELLLRKLHAIAIVPLLLRGLVTT